MNKKKLGKKQELNEQEEKRIMIRGKERTRAKECTTEKKENVKSEEIQ